MDSVDIITKLYQYHDLIKSQLNNVIQLRADIVLVIRHTQEKLSVALQRKPNNPEEIAQIKWDLENEQHLYTNSEMYIIKYQADSITTKIKIKRLEQQFKETLNKKGFFKFDTKKNHDLDKKEAISNTTCQYCQGCINSR
jgi:hypothetical protein